jgi:hypothetical protein
MPYLKWDESPHWTKPKLVLVPDEPAKEPELLALHSPRTAKEITEAILDDPRYNATNPTNQAHIVDMAIASARNNGMLIEDRELTGDTVNG